MSRAGWSAACNAASGASSRAAVKTARVCLVVLFIGEDPFAGRSATLGFVGQSATSPLWRHCNDAEHGVIKIRWIDRALCRASWPESSRLADSDKTYGQRPIFCRTCTSETMMRLARDSCSRPPPTRSTGSSSLLLIGAKRGKKTCSCQEFMNREEEPVLQL